MKYKNKTNIMNREDFLFAVVEDTRISEQPIVCVTPQTSWTKYKEIITEYEDEQYELLYELVNKAGLNELMEGVYEVKDPFMEVDEIEYELEQAGFLRDDDFIDYVLDADLF